MILNSETTTIVTATRVTATSTYERVEHSALSITTTNSAIWK